MDIYTTFEDSYFDAVDEVMSKLGITCLPIFTHTGGSEPDRDYCAMNVLRLTPTGRAQTTGGLAEFSGGRAKEYNVRHYEAVVQMTFVGNDAANNAVSFWSQLSGNTPVREAFLKNNLAPRRYSDIRRNPQLREVEWVNTFVFDFTLGFAVQTVQDVDWADFITVNNKTIPLNK